MKRGPPSTRRCRKRCRRIPTPIIALVLLAVSRPTQAQYIRSAGPQRMDSDLTARAAETQSSKSTEIWAAGYDDFCLFGPPDPFNQVWNTGTNVVSWCSKAGHGTRLIPDGTLHGVTYIKAKDWIQVSGTGDFTKINIAPGDAGGQFDSKSKAPDGAKMHLADDQEASSWVTLISATTFCMRACKGDPAFCPNQYPEQGCWFLTGNSVGPDGTWQNCEADKGTPPGVANGKTYSQDDPALPTPTAPKTSACSAGPSVKNGQSPPPLYSWDGKGTAVPIGKGSGPGGNTASSVSTTWVAVQTCTPCERGEGQPTGDPGKKADPTPAAATTSSSSTSSTKTPAPGNGGEKTTAAGGTTLQQGVTQVPGGGLVAEEKVAKPTGTTSSSTTAAPGTTPAAAGGGGGGGGGNLLERGDPGTTTSNGQCCFTTWTPSIIGGPAATPTGKTTGGATGIKTNTTSPTATGRPGGNGTLGNGTVAGGGNQTGNGTGHGTDSGACRRAGLTGLEGWTSARVAMGIATLLGLTAGRWTLV